jgi:hypothetical protein
MEFPFPIPMPVVRHNGEKMSDFRSYRKNQSRSKPPKGPIKLAFGLVPPKEEPKPVVDLSLAQNSNGPIGAAVDPKQNEPKPVVMERVELAGTLHLKRVDLKKATPLPKEHMERLEKNLDQLYEMGQFQTHRAQVDFKDGELQVMFPFDQNMVDLLKGLDRNERAWDPENKAWRVFPYIFDDVFDILGKNFTLSPAAYSAIKELIHSPYYWLIGKSKLGKLIVRESWFEQLDIVEIASPDEASYFSSGYFLQSESKRLPSPVGDLYSKILHSTQYKRKPHQHQLIGMEFLLCNPHCALLDEMGCGKSFQIAAALNLLLVTKEIERVLIVAPLSLSKTWQTELGFATQIPFEIISGSPARRKKLLESDSPIFIIHYEGLRLEEEELSKWLSAKNSALVFDESQRIKNLQAQTTVAALKIRSSVKRCIIATGTPIANRPLDLFAQYLVMDQGRTFGNKFSAFKNTFCDLDIQKIQVGRKTIRVEKFVGVRNPKILQTKILNTSLRRLKSQVLDLPPVVYKDYVVELKNEQKTMYMQMRDNLRLEISSMSEKDINKEAANIMVKLLRLSQICSNPALMDPNYKGSNAKFRELEDIVEDILCDDTKKIIIWSHFVENVSLLMEKLNESFLTVAHTGDMPLAQREASVAAFQENPQCRIIIATPQSAKEGLTLLPKDGKMVADTMIYLDLSFDSASYLQSQARFHRIGQTAEKCLVVHLMGESTVDEYIRKTIVEKIKTATQLLDENARTVLDALKATPSALSKSDFLSALEN